MAELNYAIPAPTTRCKPRFAMNWGVQEISVNDLPPTRSTSANNPGSAPLNLGYWFRNRNFPETQSTQ